MNQGAIGQIVQRFLGKPQPVNVPEDYWVNRGQDVIGQATLEQLLDTRQIDTYKAIFEAIRSRGISEVADCGCNIAALGQLLCTWGYAGRYIGVDFNPHALRQAEAAMGRWRDRCDFRQANVRELPFEAKQVQCVVIKDVLEHLEDFRAPVKEVARVSREYLIVANFIPWTEGRSIIRKEPAGYYHNLYRRRDVYDFLAKEGFELDEVLSALEKDGRANEVVVFRRVSGAGSV